MEAKRLNPKEERGKERAVGQKLLTQGPKTEYATACIGKAMTWPMIRMNLCYFSVVIHQMVLE